MSYLQTTILSLRPSRNFILFHILTFASTAISLPDPTRSCPLFSQAPCGSGLPSNFCCGMGQSCIGLAGNTTAICCPGGQSCAVIRPISCNIQLQNVTSHPNSPVKTNALGLGLIKCGQMCCPFGFICDSVNNCVKNADQTFLPNMSAPLIPSVPDLPDAPDTSDVTTTSSINLTTPSSSSNALLMPISPGKMCNKFPADAVVTGFFPGLIFGLMLAAALIYLRNNFRQKQSKMISPYSRYGYISDPQPVVVRSEFLRKKISRGKLPNSGDNKPRNMSSGNQMSYMFKRSYHPPSDIDDGLRTPLPPIPLNIRKSIQQDRNSGNSTPPLRQSMDNMNPFSDLNKASELPRNSTKDSKTESVSDFGSNPSLKRGNSTALAGLVKGQHKEEEEEKKKRKGYI